MQQPRLIPTLFAATLSLAMVAGCATPATLTPGSQTSIAASSSTNKPTAPAAPIATLPAQTGGTGSSQTAKPGVAVASTAQASASVSQETATALSEEQEMGDYEALADEEVAAAYVLAQAGGRADAVKEKIGAIGVVKGRVTIEGGALAAAGDLDALLKARGTGSVLPKAVKQQLRQAAKARGTVTKAKAKELAQDLVKQARAVVIAADLRAAVIMRKQTLRTAIKPRLEKLRNDRQKIRAAFADVAWVDNGDGTKTKTVSFDIQKTVNGKAAVRQATLVRTINADGLLLATSADFNQQLPGGLSRASSRTKTLNEDGSYTVIFHSEITGPKGGTRIADWEKSIAADGTVTGSGTIVWTGPNGTSVTKTITVALGGTEAEPQASSEDAEAGTEATVTVADGGAVTASVETDGKTSTVEIATDASGAVAVAEDSASVTLDAEGAVQLGGEAEVTADTPATADATATGSAS